MSGRQRMFELIRTGDVAGLKELLDSKGADAPKVASRSIGGYGCPIHLASMAGHVGVVSLLVGVGSARAMVTTQDSQRRFPLHCAVEKGQHSTGSITYKTDDNHSAAGPL